jgi:hypothetical protein
MGRNHVFQLRLSTLATVADLAAKSWDRVLRASIDLEAGKVATSRMSHASPTRAERRGALVARRRRTTIVIAALIPLLIVAALVDGVLLRGNSGSAPSDLSPLWTSDLAEGGFARFLDAPWNFDGGGAPAVVAAPDADEDERAVRFRLGRGDRRQEIVAGVTERDPVVFAEGDDRYFSFSMRLGERWPVVDYWQLVAQWKADGSGSPPVAMLAGAWGAPRFQLVAAGWPGAGSDTVLDLGPLARGEWIDWIVRIRFSSRPDRSIVQVWRDGELVATSRRWLPSFGGERAGSRGGTLRAGRKSYLKIGLYRDTRIPQFAQYWSKDWTIATRP